ncbi:MAG TPA: hypothetical protein VLV15_10950 [Dongiaceae bacterium]|nr:hypothetical protein [Dongiaceae bacterium]
MVVSIDDVLASVFLAMLVAAFSVWTGWRVLSAVHRQRRIELAWRERLAIWSTRIPEPPGR